MFVNVSKLICYEKISVLVLFAWSLLIVLQAQELVFQDKDGIVR